jgi:hypothetical protein
VLSAAQAALRVVDSFLSEGPKALVRYCVALLNQACAALTCAGAWCRQLPVCVCVCRVSHRVRRALSRRVAADETAVSAAVASFVTAPSFNMGALSSDAFSIRRYSRKSMYGVFNATSARLRGEAPSASVTAQRPWHNPRIVGRSKALERLCAAALASAAAAVPATGAGAAHGSSRALDKSAAAPHHPTLSCCLSSELSTLLDFLPGASRVLPRFVRLAVHARSCCRGEQTGCCLVTGL